MVISMLISKILLVLLTAVYPMFMVLLSGAGLLYNYQNYELKVCIIGVLLIVSSVFLTASALLCLPKNTRLNKLSVALSVSGLILCMTTLFELVNYADLNGWNRNFKPISNMYKSRINPVFFQSLLDIIICYVQLRKH